MPEKAENRRQVRRDFLLMERIPTIFLNMSSFAFCDPIANSGV